MGFFSVPTVTFRVLEVLLVHPPRPALYTARQAIAAAIAWRRDPAVIAMRCYERPRPRP
jgi:hypothetical protein